MKKLLPLLFLSLLWVSCSESARTPAIEIQNLYLNGDQTVDYASKVEALPLLKKGDVVTVALNLNGNGENLNTFLVQEDKESNGSSSVKIVFLDLIDDQLSGDKEFTDRQSGKLGFKDGIPRTEFKMAATVDKVTNNEVKLKLYLFSKSKDGEGAKLELKLKLGKEN